MELDTITGGNKTILVDFYSGRCGSCQTMAPILEDLQSGNQDLIDFLKIDVDQHPMIAAAFQVRSVPAFILFKKGEIIWRKAGLVSAGELENAIRENT